MNFQNLTTFIAPHRITHLTERTIKFSHIVTENIYAYTTSNIYSEREIIYLEFDDIYLSLTYTYTFDARKTTDRR